MRCRPKPDSPCRDPGYYEQWLEQINFKSLTIMTRLIFILSLLLLSSCGKVTDLSDSEPAQDQLIGRTYCTESNLFIYEYIPSSNFYDNNNADYYLATYIESPDETLEGHLSWLESGTSLEKIADVYFVGKGSKLRIQSLFFHISPLCCRYFSPIGTLQGHESKRVDLRNIFDQEYSADSPFSRFGVDFTLSPDDRYIKSCE